jgi:hypothetical protein
MKSFCWLNIWLFLSTSFAFGQSTFNKVYEIGLNTLPCAIWELPMGYKTAGWATDSVGRVIFFTNHDSEGNMTSVEKYPDDNEVWSTTGDVECLLFDDLYISGWTSFGNPSCALLFWTTSTGDTLQTRRYYSPYISLGGEYADWMRPTSIDSDPEGNIYMTSQVYHPTNHNDFIIYKLTQWGDVVWTYPVSQPGSQFCYDVKAVEDGVIVAAAPPGNYKPLMKLTSDGELDWIIQTNPNFNFITSPMKEIVPVADGVVAVCEYYTEGYLQVPLIYKVNWSGQVVWSIPMEGTPMYLQKCEHLVKSPNGGFLAAAWQYEEAPENPEVNGEYNRNAWLIKVSDDGQVEWERFYHFIESHQDNHRVYDLKATSDGGYIFCGDAIDLDIENNGNNGSVIQWGWVVKVDACGCLVPGCDPDCIYPGVEESAKPSDKPQYFVCGPNPAADFLNIYVRQTPEGATLRIHDLAGKEISRFPAGHAGLTHMASVRGWSAGVYAVSLEMGGEVLQSLKVVKE